MSKDWSECKNIVCIRPDNMGDVLMSTPAIRALKESFNCRITLLTSSMAASIARQIPEIDHVIVFDLPWIKTMSTVNEQVFFEAVNQLKSHSFDAAVIFSVCSQNPLPTVMLAYLAGIPKRLSYCRENPYHLLTHWIPDPEPYTIIQHQVRRDLNMVATVGAVTSNEQLSLTYSHDAWIRARQKLQDIHPAINKKFIVLHAGVSEKKREYSKESWIDIGKKITEAFNIPVLLSGVASEKKLTDEIQQGIGANAYSIAGLLNLDEFVALIRNATIVISVNTGTVHIASAVGTPVIVLYALTNPQHLPWRVHGKVFLYPVAESLKSRNEVIRYMDDHLMSDPVESFTVNDIMITILDFLSKNEIEYLPEMIPLKSNQTI